MILFWFVVVLLLVLTLLVLFKALSGVSNDDATSRRIHNIEITKERINELNFDLKKNIISQNEYKQIKEELEKNLLLDTDNITSTKTGSGISKNSSVVKNNSMQEKCNINTRIAFLIFIPAVAISLYLSLGMPELLDKNHQRTTASSAHMASNINEQLDSLEQMTNKLAAKLKLNPDNAEGWYMLGGSYLTLKRIDEAVVALEKAANFYPENTTVLLRYAEALKLANNGKTKGKAFEVIKRAVKLKPDDPTGLWLLGMGYEEQGEYTTAISYWQRLISLIEDNDSVNKVKTSIRQAQTKAGISIRDNDRSSFTETALSNTVSLMINVSIDRNKFRDVSIDDTVFIFAKAVNGPPVPLAAVRKQVKDLPLQVTLDDSMAMMPALKLSNFKQVQIVARISKSGSAKRMSGDLESEIYIIKTRKKEKIQLIIDSVVP